MIRLNLVLIAIAVACALATVTSRHEARKLFVALEQEQAAEHQLGVEWDQLQLEQSTWAQHSRVEKIATQRLQMHLPQAARTRVVQTDGIAPPATR